MHEEEYFENNIELTWNEGTEQRLIQQSVRKGEKYLDHKNRMIVGNQKQ